MHTNLKVMYYNLHDTDEAHGMRIAAKAVLDNKNVTLQTPIEWEGSNLLSTYNFSPEDKKRHMSNDNNSTVLKFLSITKILEAMRNVLGAHAPHNGMWKRYLGSSREAWLNVFNQGQLLAPRRQRGTDIWIKTVDNGDNGWVAACFCYFIQVNEDNPSFYFIDEEGNKSYINEKNNSLLIFSPDLRHGVDENTSTDQNIMLMGNLSFAYELELFDPTIASNMQSDKL